MSINALSSTSSVNALELNTEDYESFKQQYAEFKSIWEEISKSDSYKNNEPYITDIKKKLEELLKELDNVVEDGYDPKVVEEAMHALGSLLKGSNTMMSLEVRLKCLESLIKVLEDEKISKEDFNKILSKIDDPKTDYSEKDFYKDFYTSIIYNSSVSEEHKKAIVEKINNSEIEYNNEDFYKDYYTALIQTYFGDTKLTGNETSEELKNLYKDLTIKKTQEILGPDLEISKSLLNEAKGSGNTIYASLASKVIQANHQFKGLELEVTSDQKKEQEAQKNPMFRKLRDEGIWRENTIDRHQKMLKEERINELKNADRK